jgi:hypothetical protein
MKKNNNYKEGTLFAIPLPNNCFGIGLIARINGSVLLCYFLKRKFCMMPSFEVANSMYKECDGNFIVQKVGSLGLDKKVWTVLGILEKWERNSWPVPIFKRKILLTEKYYLVYYDDSLQNSTEKVVEYSKELDMLPNDGTAGYLIIEEKLAKI